MSSPIRKYAQRVRGKIHGDINSRLIDLEAKYDKLGRELHEANSMHAISDSVITRKLNKMGNNGHLQISETETLTKIFSGLKMYIDPRDMAVAVHIALDGIWEQEITDAWLTVLQPSDTVLDIGANYGYFGLLSSQFTEKNKAKIIMFEANPHIIPYINKSLSINWFNLHAKVENLAVSDKPGKAQLSVLKNYIGSSSLQTIEQLDSYMHEKMQLEVQETIDVATITIDEYCKINKIDDVNLIKMDIEGYEEKAYSGMRNIVKKSKNITMFIEFTKEGYSAPEDFYYLMLSDFGNVYTISDNGSLVLQKNNSYENIIGNSSQWVMPVFSKNAKLGDLKKFTY
jgi:FkbM family methyltransferase